MSDRRLTDLLPHLKAVSAADKGVGFSAEIIKDTIHVGINYATSYQTVQDVSYRRWRWDNVLGFIVYRGVIMASRGIDNVQDVCEAMRNDLAVRRSLERFPIAKAKELVDSGKRLRVTSINGKMHKTIEMDRMREDGAKCYEVHGWSGEHIAWSCGTCGSVTDDSLDAFTRMYNGHFIDPYPPHFDLMAEVTVDEVQS